MIILRAPKLPFLELSYNLGVSRSLSLVTPGTRLHVLHATPFINVPDVASLQDLTTSTMYVYIT